MTTRIICLGNRYDERCDAGPRVYDLLARGPRTADVELAESGTAGLDLLAYLDGADGVIFVEAAPDEPAERGVSVWTAPCFVTAAAASGLAHLLRGTLSAQGTGGPIIWVVRVHGQAEDWKLDLAADWTMHLARTGRALRVFRERELAA